MELLEEQTLRERIAVGAGLVPAQGLADHLFCVRWLHGAEVLYPSASPWVVSAGGTTVNRNASGNFVNESC